MKTRNFLLSGILGIALAGFALTGCHKASSNPDTDYTAAQDETNGTMAANDTKGVSDAAVSSSSHGPVHSASTFATEFCSSATITWSNDSSTTISVTINFGSTPVSCNDGRYRKGEIIVSWPAKSSLFWWQAYLDSATTITESFNGYAVGKSTTTMYGVAGSRTWTNEGINATSGDMNWNFNANLTITNPEGKTFTWTSNRVNTLTEVGGVWYYAVTGNATGVTESGVTYTLTITSPLYVTVAPWWKPLSGGCAWIEAGKVNITRSTSTNTLTIDFGSIGSCDANATATLNGNSYPITMW